MCPLHQFCAREKDAFELLKEDPLKPFVPQYYDAIKEDDCGELRNSQKKFLDFYKIDEIFLFFYRILAVRRSVGPVYQSMCNGLQTGSENLFR